MTGAPAAAQLQYWDGAGTTANNVVNGGTGNFSATATNWTNATGTANTAFGGSLSGIFQGTAGLVTVVDPIAFEYLSFDVDGYTLLDGGGSLIPGFFSGQIEVLDGVTATINATLTGANTLYKLNTGTLVLGAANSFTGGVALDAGTLAFANSVALGTGTVDMNDGGTLRAAAARLTIANQVSLTSVANIDSNGFDFTLAGFVNGTGMLNKVGEGVLTLSGINDYSDGTEISAGAVSIGADENLGTTGTSVSFVGTGTTLITTADFSSDRSLILTSSGTVSTAVDSDVLLTGLITGAGGLTKSGDGTLTLSAVNDYAGATSVTAGKLFVDGTNSGTGAVDVAAAATLGGTGTIAGTVTVADAATIAPGVDAPGTLTVGGLVLGNSSFLDFQLGAADDFGAAVNDRIIVNGALTLDGILNVSNSSAFGAGVYNLISYTGALTDNELLIGDLPFLTTGIIQTAITGQVNLIVTTGGVLVQYWDGANAGGDTVIDGGSGTWNLTNANWAQAPLVGPDDVWQGGYAAFAGTAGTVGLGDALTVQGLQFATTGYVLEDAGGGSLVFDAATFISTDNGVTTTITAPITGAGSLLKQGAGNLILDGTNTYTGGTTINAGTLTVANDDAVSTGAVTIQNNATLATNIDGVELANDIVTEGRGRIANEAGVTFTLAGAISGAGSIDKFGAGNLVLSGTNSFTGGLAIDAGTLTLASTGAASTGEIAISGTGTLVAGIDNLVLQNAVALTGAAQVDSGAGLLTLAGPIVGTGALLQIGTGTLVLAGSNGFTGGIGIEEGRVDLGSNTAAGTGAIAIGTDNTLGASATGLVVANAVLVSGNGNIDAGAGVLTLTGVISGPGTVTKIGAGNLVLGGGNSFTDGLNINAGTVTASSNTALGTGLTTIAGGATLAGVTGVTLANAITTTGAARIDSGTGVFTLAGVVGGAGGLTKVGTGNLVLSGTNSYTGATLVDAGRLTVSGVTLSATRLASGASLGGTGRIGSLTALAGSTVSPGATNGTLGTLSVTGAASFAAGSTLLIDVTPAGSDLLAIGGAATLGGTLSLSFAGGTYSTVTSYTILTAAGGATGTFAATTLGNLSPLYSTALTYGANSVTLRLTTNSLVSRLGTGASSNVGNRAAAFDAAVAAGLNPQTFLGLFTQGAGTNAAVNQLTGEITPASTRQVLTDTRFVREAALDRLSSSLRDGDGVAATTDAGGNSFTTWARGVASWADADSDGNGGALNIDSTGILAGADYTSAAGFKVGALFSTLKSNVDTAQVGSGDVKSTGGAIYAGYRAAGGLAVGVGGSVASVDTKTYRSVSALGQTLRGKSDGTVYQAFGEIAFDLAATEKARIEPFARVAYVKYDLDGSTETGGVAALVSSDEKYDITVASAGLRGSLALGSALSLRGSAAYQRISGDRSPIASLALVGTTSAADIRAVALDKDSFVGDAGVDVALSPSATLGFAYSGVIGKNNTDNGLKATLGFTF